MVPMTALSLNTTTRCKQYEGESLYTPDLPASRRKEEVSMKGNGSTYSINSCSQLRDTIPLNRPDIIVVAFSNQVDHLTLYTLYFA